MRPSLPLAALALLGACQGTPAPAPTPEPYTPPQYDYEPPEIGYFLVQFDLSLQHWSQLRNDTRDEQDARKLQALEADLRRRARLRKDELVRSLESGPPKNREVAAVALGFTDDPAVLSPLLAALGDPSEGVVQKALLGLGILGSPETPLAPLTDQLAAAGDPWTRSNAAYAILRVVSAGAAMPGLEAECRAALYDSEPGVRAQAASVLGLLQRPESIPGLGYLLADEVPLVARAAMTALARIGRALPEEKGTVARLLVDELEDARRQRRRFLLQELRVLREADLGDADEDWRRWAENLP